MVPKSVNVDQAIAWFACGWKIFAQNPGTWVVLGVILLAIDVVLWHIPFIGSFALALLGPLLIAGLLYGATELQAGRPLELGHLFHAFQDGRHRIPLLLLGVVAVVSAVVCGLILLGFMGGALAGMMAGDPSATIAVGTGAAIAALLVLAILSAVSMALFYAVPLVVLGDVPAGAAMQSSIRACVQNFLSLLVFSVIYTVLAIVATLPLGLGWLVLLPWSIGMLYCSYQDIYGT